MCQEPHQILQVLLPKQGEDAREVGKKSALVG